MLITFLIILVLSICYWEFFYKERTESEAERQVLLASIEKLKTMSLDTFTEDNHPQNPLKKHGRPKKSNLPEV